jgi:hypothetical protein
LLDAVFSLFIKRVYRHVPYVSTGFCGLNHVRRHEASTMTISVDTTNAAMALIGGVLALLAALLTLLVAVLPKEGAIHTVRSIVSRAATATPSTLALVGVLTYTLFGSKGVGLAVFGFALTIQSVQFLRRSEPASRIEVFILVFHFCMFTALVMMDLVSSLIEVLGSLVKALGK